MKPTPKELYEIARQETATPWAAKQLYLVLAEQHGYLHRRVVLSL